MAININVGDVVTDGTTTCKILAWDSTGIMLDNGYCPNLDEFAHQKWQVVKPDDNGTTAK